ncbi:MAG: 23S rRNA (uracil(1939)-C(5))-methyltransferase RlmD [Cyanobacteria bacterium SBLK]|nr:23S rRNA (uracil(1939)-C(5))-methyltransferase RlmD [Cyanobacteria bacterium SBLK]
MKNSEKQWQQGNLVEVEITDVSDRGDGVGRWQDRVVFVPDTVTGDRVSVRLLRVKSQYAYGGLIQLLRASPHRLRPSCIVADKCGGCQWQHVHPVYQQEIKRNLILQALQRIGGFVEPPVAPLLAIANVLAYRNKAAYPLGITEGGAVRAGYYRKGSHQIVNLNQCPIQDARLNPLLAQIKQDIAARGWSIYDERRRQGQLRHLALRIGRHTGEILLTLVTTDLQLRDREEMAKIWMQQYPNLVGVCLNYNPHPTNAIFGDRVECLAGRPYLREIFAGLELHLRPQTFFQVNTEAAEAMLASILEKLDLQGSERLLDAYCGIGTFSLPFARQVREVVGIEIQAASVEQARHNVALNGITNIRFEVAAVEDWLPRQSKIPDIVFLDPPRKGCDRIVIETLLRLEPSRLVYLSCKPATLARDLKILCQSGQYRLTHLQPADFFPQTAHVECVAFLERDRVS